MALQRDSLGIQRISSVHMFVHDLERTRDHYVNDLDFAETAVSAPEFEAEHQELASVLEAGDVCFVLLEPLGPESESYQWLQHHPEGVGRVVFDVADVGSAFAILDARGATMMTGIEHRHADGWTLSWFDIATALGDTVFRFVQRDTRAPILPNLRRLEPPLGGGNIFGISRIDHITTNFLTLQPALAWMERVMGLEQFWEISFHTSDVNVSQDGGSGLKSIVMWDRESGVKFANNEPARPFFQASQIYRFYRDHRGAGVQHIALSVANLVAAVDGLRTRGADFMPTPAAYYEELARRLDQIGVRHIEEDIDELRRLQILVDGRADRQYMLQIFMKEAAALHHDPQAGPFFIELLQRKGDDGFGGGNFRALFESIERQQQMDAKL